MTPEHKALVAKLRDNVGRLTEEDCTAAATAIESLSAQPSQPQAGEAVGYVTPDSIAEVAAGRIGNHLFPKGTLRPENEIPVYASPQPANPAQVTELLKELRGELEEYEQAATGETYNNTKLNAAIAAIGAGGQAVTVAVAEPDCKHGGKHGPWTRTYMGSSCDHCGYFAED